MAIGSLGYVVNDALVRRASEEGMGVYQVLFLRSVGLAVLFAVLGWRRGDRIRREQLTRPVLARTALEVVAAALFFAAIVRMEFANAQAILQVVPFAVTLTAALVLRERVSGRQYLAVLMGFAGVLIIIRPATDGFSAWSLMVVASAAGVVAREFATRRVPRAIPASSIAWVTAVGLALLTGAISFFTGWTSVDGATALWIVLAMASLGIGYHFTIETVRVGDLSVSAPFRYTVLLGAIVLGYVMFGEPPDLLTIIGSVVIVLSGVYAIILERSRVPESNR